MENDIALMVSGYVFTRLSILAAVGYIIFRVLQPEPERVPVRAQRDISYERPHSFPRD